MRVAACKAGLPFDVAFAEDDGFVNAWNVAAGEVEGHEYDWGRERWQLKRPR